MKQELKGRVLFVNSHADTCEMMTQLLRQAGYETVTVSGCKAALSATRLLLFDLILLDSFLEDGSGVELCQSIRQNDKQTPIFFYTGLSRDTDLKTAMKAGAQGCFIKPVDTGKLIEVLDRQVG